MEAWINDKMALVTSSDYGKDEDASDRLLAKNKVTIVPLLQCVCLKLVTRLNMLTPPPPTPHPFFSVFSFPFCNKGFLFDEYLL